MPWKVRLIFRVDLTNVMKTSECHLQQIQDWKPNDLRIETFYNHSPYRLFGVVSDKTSVGPRKDPRLSHQCRWKWLRIMAQALFSEMVKGTFCLPWQTLWGFGSENGGWLLWYALMYDNVHNVVGTMILWSYFQANPFVHGVFFGRWSSEFKIPVIRNRPTLQKQPRCIG